MDARQKIVIIPEPKKVIIKEGIFLLREHHKIKISSNLISIGKLLEKAIARICRLKLKIEEIEKVGEILEVTTEKESPKGDSLSCFEGLEELGEEGYIINIEQEKLTITGNQSAGIFYGVQTFIQLLENDTNIQCCFIKDWPDMKIRGIHFDLKGVMPTFEYLIRSIKNLSKYKINTILMEYEDKFKYNKHSIISSRVALSKEEIKKLIKIAKNHYIRIIPLIQCLGHVEYVLKHKEYRDIAEDNQFRQYCPLNPKTFELYNDFLSEVLELHKDSKYFHIGGDETRSLGKCKKCREKAYKYGKEKVYIDYIKQIIELIKNKGKTPIVWHDMLISANHPEIVKELPKETIIMYWLYNSTTNEIPYLLWQGAKASRKWYKKNNWERAALFEKMLPLPESGYIEEIPENVMKIYKNYWSTNSFPMMVKAFPYIKFFHDRGYKVIGGSAVRTSRDERFFPNHVLHIGNIKMWASQIVKNGGLGVISTAWARSNSMAKPNVPFELCWYSIVASAEYYWSARQQITENKFDAKFNTIFFGITSSHITEAIYLLTKGNTKGYPELALEKIKKVEKKIKKNKDNLNYLKLSAMMLSHELWKRDVFCFIENSYYRKLTDYECRQTKEWLNGLKTTCNKLINNAEKILSKTMPYSEVNEFLSSLYKLDEKKMKEYIKLITTTEDKKDENNKDNF